MIISLIALVSSAALLLIPLIRPTMADTFTFSCEEYNQMYIEFCLGRGSRLVDHPNETSNCSRLSTLRQTYCPNLNIKNNWCMVDNGGDYARNISHKVTSYGPDASNARLWITTTKDDYQNQTDYFQKILWHGAKPSFIKEVTQVLPNGRTKYYYQVLPTGSQCTGNGNSLACTFTYPNITNMVSNYDSTTRRFKYMYASNCDLTTGTDKCTGSPECRFNAWAISGKTVGGSECSGLRSCALVNDVISWGGGY